MPFETQQDIANEITELAEWTEGVTGFAYEGELTADLLPSKTFLKDWRQFLENLSARIDEGK